MADKKSFPAFGWGVLLILIMFGVQFVGAIILVVVMAIEDSQYDMLVPTIIFNSAAFFVILAISIAKIKKPFKEIFYHKKINPQTLLAIILVTVGLTILLSDVDNIMRYFFPMPNVFITLFESLYSPENIIASFILLVIIAPVTEEYIFRGVILRGFLKNYNPVKAIVLSSILFSAAHVNPWQMISTFIGGLFLGWVYYKTESMTHCIVIHGVFNAVPLVVINLLDIEIEGFSSDFVGPVQFQPLYFDLLGLLFICSGLYLLWKFFKSSRNEMS